MMNRVVLAQSIFKLERVFFKFDLQITIINPKYIKGKKATERKLCNKKKNFYKVCVN